MRTFTLGSGTGRKFVVIEVKGPRLTIVESKSDGTTKRSEKEWASEAQARAACDRMARELVARGFAEQAAATPSKPKRPPAVPRPAAAAAPAAAPAPGDVGLADMLAEEDEPVAEAAPLLPRMAAAQATEEAPKKKKKRKKKRKNAEGGDGLDKRVIALAGAIGAALVALLAFFVYDAFLKPASIVGTWKGSRLEYEVGRPMTHSSYGLVLDGQHRASMTLGDSFTLTGTYAVKGGRLLLDLKDEDGDATQMQYKVDLGGATLDLYDPDSGKKVVQLVRMFSQPAVGGGAPAPAAPTDLAAGGGGQENAADDARLASVEFTPKDGAFRLRHPAGWEVETGSRPDNTYSWARFTRGSARIQVFADVAGSLMSGSDTAGQYEEGSEMAPVHRAHELYKKTVSEEYSDYKESTPALFKNQGLGEGRVAAFSASGGGLFGSRLRGVRVTLLTNDRRVTVLCDSPDGEFAKLQPTFLAVCRSVTR